MTQQTEMPANTALTQMLHDQWREVSLQGQDGLPQRESWLCSVRHAVRHVLYS
jgi:hypothetical protein